jgi:hypothetical protein
MLLLTREDDICRVYPLNNQSESLQRTIRKNTDYILSSTAILIAIQFSIEEGGTVAEEVLRESKIPAFNTDSDLAA